jgi:flavorubredoxin
MKRFISTSLVMEIIYIIIWGELMAIKITDNVYWVGAVDWDIRKFHGDEYSTHRGTTYNSYLIKGEKNVVIDTVYSPFATDFIRNLSGEIDLNNIDYVVANHAEVDHSGALPELMKHIPDTPVYCSRNGIKSIKGHYHKDWNFKTVKTGDKLSLGDKELTFIEAPLLHWPDSMMCYLSGDNILFSNDAFGQHYATKFMFNDLVNQDELYTECEKYYANILTPYSKLVTKKINEVLAFKLQVDYICTSHGVIWRDNPTQIVEKYLKWADNYQEDQITIIYDTMWNGTRIMAENIARGIEEVDNKITIKLYNSSRSDKNDIITDVFKSKGIVVGCPTINNGLLNSIAGILEQIRGLKFQNKRGAAFGCYGWTGWAVKMITESLNEAGFEAVAEGLKVPWSPDEEGISQCIAYGRKIGESF